MNNYSKNIKENDKKTENLKRNNYDSDSETISESYSSESYSDDDDDDHVVIEYDLNNIIEDDNKIKYNKFLYSLFPSTHLHNKIKQHDENSNDENSNDERISNDENSNDENSNDERNSNDENISNDENSNDENISNDENSNDENSNDEHISNLKNSTEFNIIFSIGNQNNSSNESNDEEDSTEYESNHEEEIEFTEEEKKEKEEEKINKEKNKKLDYSFSKVLRLLEKNKYDNIPDELLKKMDNYIKKTKNKRDRENKRREEIKRKNKKEKEKNTKQFKKLLQEKNKVNDTNYFKKLSLEKQKYIINELENINKEQIINKPYRISLIERDIPIKYKAYAINKINRLRYMDPSSSEYYKLKQWVDTFMTIPFGNYSKLPISIDDGIDKCSTFLNNAKDVLDSVVYGMNDAKMQIMQMLGQLISNPESIGTSIAINGPPGTGKTSIVKNGISKILKRPFEFISLGGSTDSSFLEGHSYTYEGSLCGKIVNILIKSKTMNPVIYFDELDKISDTPKGEEIIGILTHLTDTTQNSQFHDKYFSNIDFDLSKVLFIFSYNDESKINPILKDRMYCIKTNGYKTKDKIEIANKYLIPKIIDNIKFNKEDVIIPDKTIEYIINNLTGKEKGVRNLKRCLEIIYTKLNLYRLMNISKGEKLLYLEDSLTIEFPIKINIDIINKLIKKEQEDTLYSHIYT
jgi:ATP-dependent Lon protease